jgi:hypothetical protein
MPDWRWPAARLVAAFVVAVSAAVGVALPMGPIQLVLIALVAFLVALSLFALIASDVRTVLRIGVATAFAAIAAFGAVTPWALCEWAGTAYVGVRVCPPDCDEKKSTQASRLKWAAGLSVAAATLLLLPPRFFDGGAAAIARQLRDDAVLVARRLGLN